MTSPSSGRLVLELESLIEQRKLLIEAIGLLSSYRYLNNEKLEAQRLDLLDRLTKAVF